MGLPSTSADANPPRAGSNLLRTSGGEQWRRQLCLFISEALFSADPGNNVVIAERL